MVQIVILNICRDTFYIDFAKVKNFRENELKLKFL